MKTLFFIFALPILAAQPRQSFVVSPDGDDRNPGSVLKPWKTLGKAAQSMQPGDTVFIREGEYPAGTVLRRSGSAKRPIVLRNFPGERPKINGHGKSRFGLVLDKVRFVQVRGLEFLEILTPHPRRRDVLHEQGAILLRESSDCLIDGNLIVTGGLPGYTEDNPGATGIQLWSRHEDKGGKGCHRNVIRGNDISKSSYATHLRGPARQNIFEGNYWHDNNEMRQHSDGTKSESIDYLLNHPKGYVESYRDLLEPGWAAHTPRENIFRYNIAERNSDEGIDTWISVKNTIEYNLCTDSGTVKLGNAHGFKLGPGGFNMVRFNIARGNRRAGYTDNGGTGNKYENNFSYREHKGAGGRGVTAINNEHEWKKRVGPIEKKIRDLHAALVETAPPNPPRNVRRTRNVLRWQPPVVASDGDTANCYLVFDDRRLIGITTATSFELPRRAGTNVSVVAVDDSFSDNRSAASELPDSCYPGESRVSVRCVFSRSFSGTSRSQYVP